MAASIARGLERIKEDLGRWVSQERIAAICREAGYTWRTRTLDPATTLHVFIQQVLHGNTAMTHLRHLSGLGFSASAYCQARQRLPLAVVQRVVREVADGAMRQTGEPVGTWMEHRTFLVDGSSCSMSDTPELRQAFGVPGGQKPGCGFPVAKLMGRYDARTGLLLEPMMRPLRTHEMSAVGHVHAGLQTGDLLVADRGLSSYAHVAMAQRGGIHGVFRAHQRYEGVWGSSRRRPRKRSGSNKRRRVKKRRGRRMQARVIRALGKDDYLVEWVKPKKKPDWMDAADYQRLPERVQVRELRYRVRDPGCRTRVVILVTTLVDPIRYPKRKLVALYRIRWRVEQYLRDLKQTLRMDVLRGQTEDIVRKELAVYALVYNLIRLVIHRASRKQRITATRVSFVDAVRWLQTASPGEPVPRLLVNPRRPGRHAPRVVKRRPKQYPRMTKPRHQHKETRSPWRQTG